MKAEILDALEPKLSGRKQKARAGEPMKIGFLQYGRLGSLAHLDSLKSWCQQA